MKKHLLPVLVFAVLALFASHQAWAGGGQGASQPASSGAGLNAGKSSVVLAMSSTWETLMPFNTTSNYGDIIFGQIYDKLVYAKGDYSIAPRLAQSWTPAADKSYITVKLDPAAKWHDGRPVTADDIVFTSRLITNPGLRATKRSNFSHIAGTDNGGALEAGKTLGVEAVDANTVIFRFKGPMDPDIFLYQFCRNFYALPKHTLEGKTIDELNNGDFWAQNPVGSGPFKYVSQISGERITLSRNTAYHLGSPKFETLIIRVVPTTSMLAGLQTGEIDIISGGGTGTIPMEDWEAAQKDSRLATLSHPTLGYQCMNISMAKPYLTPPVRQAINMAVNRQAIVDGLLNGEGQMLVAHAFVKGHPYYQDTYVREYNPQKAKDLLKQANWDSNRVLKLLVPAGNTVRERSALLIQQDLAAVGIKAEITTVDFATLMADSQKPDGPDLNLVGSAGSLDPDESSGWYNPVGATNFSAFAPNQTEIWDLYVKGRQGTSLAERKPIYDQIQKLSLETGCRLFLYVTNALVAYNPRISNADIQSFASVNWDTWNWVVK
jgi:peptide/nickel transport system substrate-binding protein